MKIISCGLYIIIAKIRRTHLKIDIILFKNIYDFTNDIDYMNAGRFITFLFLVRLHGKNVNIKCNTHSYKKKIIISQNRHHHKRRPSSIYSLSILYIIILIFKKNYTERI